MQIVINRCFGGFSLSEEGLAHYNQLAGTNVEYYFDMQRTDPFLVQTVKELGQKAFGRYADLKIVNVPDNIEWYIDDYDGKESVHEQHEIWD